MKKKKGFTLVELLAVIVILAVILVIAVPQIMSVIESARKGSIESTAKLIAEGAEREYTNRKILGKDTNIKCSDVSSMNSNDYGTCVITFDNAGKATVKVTGKGKFEGYTCNGNSTNMECVKGEIPGSTETAAQYFSYSDVNDGTEVVKTVDVTIKDKNKCESYLASKYNIPDGDEEGKKYKETICTGGTYDGDSMSAIVSSGDIPSSDYETAGLEVNWIIINNVTVKDKDKCVAYLQTAGAPEEEANTVCSGGAVDGMTLKEGVQGGFIPSSDYETAGLEVTTVEEEIIITGYNVDGGLDVVIPSMINGKKVVGIARNAFTSEGVLPTNISNTKKASISYLYNNRNVGTVRKIDISVDGLGITSVVIPNTVTSIGDGAFMRNQLTSLIIPNSVTSIGAGAFGSNQLTEVTIPSSVTSIGQYAFDNNQIIEVTIPSSVTSIGAGAFRNNKLTEVTIPNTVTSIGEYAFAYNQLTEVIIPNSVTSIGGNAFEGNQLTEVTIPSSVTSIGRNAFSIGCGTSTCTNNVCTCTKVSGNENLSKIINKTGRSFDWDAIINNSNKERYTFETGSVSSDNKANWNVEITK